MKIHGTVEPGFEPVREVFAQQLADSLGGGAFAVLRRGVPVVDLWAGVADPRTDAPWRRDTLTPLFSGTKGIAATVVAALIGRGMLDHDERVATYWPEFAAAGKGDVRVHHIMAHTVGLPYVDPEPDGAFAVFDNDANAAALARQAPLWEPGSKVGYHALTYGYLVGELVRRATGRRLGTLVRELVTEPYQLDLHLGTPAELDERIARVVRSPDYRISTFLHDEERRETIDRMYRLLLSEEDFPNSPEFRRAEHAGATGIGTARAMARLYDLLGAGRVIPVAGLEKAMRTFSDGFDVLNDRPVHFGLGFELPDVVGTYGPVSVAFGHSGAGGGRHGSWPLHHVGFSFVTSEMRSEDQDGRARLLLEVLHEQLLAH
ncbi:serine hydrolase domain-containing protein [Amycolatopsis minnesotensis]|uniref:Serine hydrolase domain-containing protein n=1 Tax=Amycolatopsis minnesotensis TaxID=337894 RepID=A0ABN2RZ32_9PSEU